MDDHVEWCAAYLGPAERGRRAVTNVPVLLWMRYRRRPGSVPHKYVSCQICTCNNAICITVRTFPAKMKTDQRVHPV